MTPRFLCFAVSLLFIAACLHPVTSVAQAPASANKAPVPCPAPEMMPEYPGGQAALLRFIGENVRYPELAKQQGIQGKVVVKFMIDTAGVVRNATIQKGIGGGCDEEALRVISALARFTPGMQDCKPINIYWAVPVSFNLTLAKRK